MLRLVVVVVAVVEVDENPLVVDGKKASTTSANNRTYHDVGSLSVLCDSSDAMIVLLILLLVCTQIPFCSAFLCFTVYRSKLSLSLPFRSRYTSSSLAHSWKDRHDDDSHKCRLLCIAVVQKHEECGRGHVSEKNKNNRNSQSFPSLNSQFNKVRDSRVASTNREKFHY